MSADTTPARRHQLRRPTWLVWLLAGAAIGAAAVAVTVDHSGSTLRGSGVPAEQTRVVPAFKGVELAGSLIATVRVGSPRSVVVRADDNLLSHVTTTVRSGRLVIDTPGSFSTRTPTRVAVTTPSFDALALSGSGILSVQNVRARTLTVTLTGSGVLRAGGTADRLVATLGGSGVEALSGVVARDAHAVVTGSGRIDLTVTRALDASIVGAGGIVYGGNPKHVTTSVTGKGAITQGGGQP
jgi:putative autotransporter adhesin-like protein